MGHDIYGGDRGLRYLSRRRLFRVEDHPAVGPGEFLHGGDGLRGPSWLYCRLKAVLRGQWGSPVRLLYRGRNVGAPETVYLLYVTPTVRGPILCGNVLTPCIAILKRTLVILPLFPAVSFCQMALEVPPLNAGAAAAAAD